MNRRELLKSLCALPLLPYAGKIGEPVATQEVASTASRRECWTRYPTPSETLANRFADIHAEELQHTYGEAWNDVQYVTITQGSAESSLKVEILGGGRG